ncbi:hypothetical protein HWI79_477 [Cryptosporidium felis]|nr:hypothetical protein HWI79_477 [Cryptosporidium felis]
MWSMRMEFIASKILFLSFSDLDIFSMDFLTISILLSKCALAFGIFISTWYPDDIELLKPDGKLVHFFLGLFSELNKLGWRQGAQLDGFRLACAFGLALALGFRETVKSWVSLLNKGKDAKDVPGVTSHSQNIGDLFESHNCPKLVLFNALRRPYNHQVCSSRNGVTKRVKHNNAQVAVLFIKTSTRSSGLQVTSGKSNARIAKVRIVGSFR